MKRNRPLSIALVAVCVLVAVAPVAPTSAAAQAESALYLPLPCCGQESTSALPAVVPPVSSPAAAGEDVAAAANVAAIAAPDPAAPAAAETTSEGEIYVVEPGDTISKIAARYGVSAAALVRANGLDDSDVIRVGQRLTIPGTGSPSAPAAPQAAQVQWTGTYIVDPGDTLSAIAQLYGVTAAALARVNGLDDSDIITVGQRLVVPSGGGSASTTAASPEKARGSVTDRLTYTAKAAGPDSPFYKTTWVTYYGRPGVPVMGILGEYSLDGLVPLLRAAARSYDQANGPNLGVMPAFHLIYGMATSYGGDNDSHLVYMKDDETLEYIKRAQTEGFGVILDVQIGNLTPLDAITPAFQFLQYGNVHLALDPEFATDQPGVKIGAITTKQINRVQAAMGNYLQANGLKGRRILIVHQFLSDMIINNEDIYRYNGVDLAICADGYGAPWPKISKYNAFMADAPQFTGFKLFYTDDQPLMTPRQALGVDPYPGIGYMDLTPNIIIYQ